VEKWAASLSVARSGAKLPRKNSVISLTLWSWRIPLRLLGAVAGQAWVNYGTPALKSQEVQKLLTEKKKM
jgi:hypothetical protein